MIYCIQSKALHSFFNLVPNVDFIVVEDYETFKKFMDGYEFLFDTPRKAELIHYEDMNIEYSTWKEEARRHNHKVKYNYKINPFNYRRQQNEKKYVTSSIIDVSWAPLETPRKPDRVENLAMRSMQSDDVKEFMKILQAYPDFRDLGDSRKFDSSEQLIEKLDYAQHSRMYIGSSCSWSKIAVRSGSSTYPFVNMQYFKPYRSRLDLITYTLLGVVKY